MDLNLFRRYIKFADSYRVSSINIYFFLKDCGFTRIYKSYGNRFPNPEVQNMCNQFQGEMSQAKWQRNRMQRDEYSRFLEDFFKKMDFNSIDLETTELLKLLTENLGIFGGFDDLTNKRIIYFNNKIEKLKKSGSYSSAGSKSANNYTNTPQNNFSSGSGSKSTNTVTNNAAPANTNDLGLPEAGKGMSKDAKKAAQAAEDARLNEIMRQQKLNSPVYITNMKEGDYYNPLINTNYIPQGIDNSIHLPMSKKDPNYPKLRSIIEEELISANQELDYHKIDMARNHLEKAAYYLSKVVE